MRANAACHALLCGWLAFSLVLAASRTALAFRTGGDVPQTAQEQPVRWASTRVELIVNEETPEGMIATGTVLSAEEAAAAWSSVPCSSLYFVNAGITDSPAVRGDGLNTIQWVKNGWKSRGFAANEAAITDVQYEGSSVDGWSIVEADLYLNAESFEWAFGGDVVTEGKHNLVSVLRHELGHVLGLLHPCEVQADRNTPQCGDDDRFVSTTMYPLYQDKVLPLSEDDMAGECFLYPGVRCEVVGCAEGQRCTEAGCRSECDDALCDEQEVCREGQCVTLEQSEAECTTDSQCRTKERCLGGVCRVATGLAGDPCEVGSTCSDGACSTSAVCLQACESNADCPGGVACTGSAPMTCGTDGLRVGSVCQSADECAGGYCVADVLEQPFCSRSCDSSRLCPRGWRCADVNGAGVCVQPVFEENCGCSVPGSRGNPGLSISSLFLMAAGIYAWRRIGVRVAAHS
jgi:hypothetical protein